MALGCCIICFRTDVESNSLPNFSVGSEYDGVKRKFKSVRDETDTEINKKLFQKFFKLLERHLSVGNGADSVGNDNRNASQIFSDYANNFSKLPACAQCSILLGSFCELYEKIKTLELQLNWKMWTVMNIMKSSRRVPERLTFFQDCAKQEVENHNQKSGMDLQYSKEEMIESILKYKQRLIKRCSIKLTNGYPKLFVERIQKLDCHSVKEEGDPLHNAAPGPTNCNLMPLPVVDVSKEEFSMYPVESPSPTGNFEEASCGEFGTSSPAEKKATQAPVVVGSAKLESQRLKPIPITNSRAQQNHVTKHEISEQLELDLAQGNGSDPFVKPLSSELGESAKVEFILPNKTEIQIKTDVDANGDADEIDASALVVAELKLSSIPEEEGKDDDDEDELPIDIPMEYYNNNIDETDDDDEDDHILSSSRQLRTKHRCKKCQKIFSNSAKLADHVCRNSSKSDDDEENSDISDNDDEIESETDDDDKDDPPEEKPNRIRRSKRKNNEDVDYDEFCLDTDGASSPGDDDEEVQNEILNDATNNKPIKQKRTTTRTGSSSKKSTATAKSAKPARPSPNARLRVLCPEPSCNQFFRDIHEMASHRQSAHDMSPETGESKQKNIFVEILQFSENRKKNSSDFLDKRMQQQSKRLHARIEISGGNVFSCPEEECQQIFFFKEDFETHSKLHGEFKCESCDFVGNYAIKLAEHELTNHGHGTKTKGGTISGADGGGGKMTCARARCDFTFEMKAKYLEHYVTTHLNLKRMEQGCPICRFTFVSTRREVFAHLKDYHNLDGVDKEKLFKCVETNCSAYFLTEKQLRRHFIKAHTTTGKDSDRKVYKMFWKKAKCEDCGKFYKNKKSLKDHRERFHSSSMISCTVEGCRHFFDTETELNFHLTKTHSGSRDTNMKTCPKCSKKVIGATLLKKHMAAHERREKLENGELPMQRWVCKECGKVFKRKSRLQHHQKFHEGPETWAFSCSVCNRKCVDQFRLTEHMRTHTGEKPFKCKVCSQKFGHRHNLRIHVNNKHGDVMQDLAKKVDTSNHKRKWNPEEKKAKGKKRGRPAKKKKKVSSDEEESSMSSDSDWSNK